MDAWERQRSLSRGTVVWGAASVIAGLAASRRPGPWWRGFGQQHAGWGLINLAIVAVLDDLRRRRMRRLADPYTSAALDHERHRLRVILAANAVADAGYCVLGLVLRRNKDPRAAGAGAAIVVQGGFLPLHDGYHAARSKPAAGHRQPSHRGGNGSAG